MKPELAKCARIIVEKCAGTKGGEETLVLSDTSQNRDIYESLVHAAYSSGADCSLLVFPTRSDLKSTLPKGVIAAMKYSDVVLIASVKPLPVQILEEVRKTGTRILSMAKLNEDAIIHSVPIDYDELQAELKEFTAKFEKADTVEVTSDEGTNVSMRIKGRKTTFVDGLIRQKGELDYIPAGVIGVSPLEGTSNGRLVIDGSVAGMGLLTEPIVAEIKNGRVAKFSGGKQALALEKTLSVDENGVNIAEIGIGMNPKARLIGGPEDERLRGSFHVGFGHSEHLGGAVRSKVHVDVIVSKPTLKLDGKPLIERGKVLR